MTAVDKWVSPSNEKRSRVFRICAYDPRAKKRSRVSSSSCLPFGSPLALAASLRCTAAQLGAPALVGNFSPVEFHPCVALPRRWAHQQGSDALSDYSWTPE